MPIYAYKCGSCGFAKDALQKMSDPPLTVCPSCGEPTFTKQLTAAGFQLKGSGWYVTDFREGNKGGGAKDKSASDGDSAAKPAADGAAKTDGAAASAPAAAPAPAPAPAAAPASTPASSGSSSDK